MPRRAPLTCPFAQVLIALSLGTACGGGPADTEDDGRDTDAPSTSAPSTDATGGATTGGATTGDATDPAWMTPYCYTVADKKWLAPWIEREQQVLELVNQARAAGATCGSKGTFDPAGPLTLEARLHCAARKHSADMAERDFFDHVNPDGEDPFDRMAQAGYTSYASAGENIAAGSADPAQTVQGWLASDEHCANMMNLQYKHFGIGFYEGPGEYDYYWTQTFAAPLQ